MMRGIPPWEPVSTESLSDDKQGALLYPAGRHRNMHPSHLTHGKTRERNVEKNAVEWTKKAETRKGDIPDSRRCLNGYFLTYSRLSRENL